MHSTYGVTHSIKFEIQGIGHHNLPAAWLASSSKMSTWGCPVLGAVGQRVLLTTQQKDKSWNIFYVCHAPTFILASQHITPPASVCGKRKPKLQNCRLQNHALAASSLCGSRRMSLQRLGMEKLDWICFRHSLLCSKEDYSADCTNHPMGLRFCVRLPKGHRQL